MVANTREPMPDFENMGIRSLIVQMATTQHHQGEDIVEIKGHAKETNGTVSDLVIRAAKLDGAMWVLGIIMAVMTLGVAIAGLVLGILLW